MCHKKSSNRSTRPTLNIRSLLAAAAKSYIPVIGFSCLLPSFSSLTYAAPTGGEVVSGTGDISQHGNTTIIDQSSQYLSINWQTFNTNPKEIVDFIQPSASAIAVNRIADTNGTVFLGQLDANGQVFVINPNGVLFGEGAQVNVGGLVTSTLNVSDSSLGGNTLSFSGSGRGSVINQGKINTDNGGYAALIGNHVSNQGVITAQLGTVALGGGSAVTLSFHDTGLAKVQVDQSTLHNLVENKQLIIADGGQVIMTAGARDSLLTSVVNNTGVIEAHTVAEHNGIISLQGGISAGTVNLGGTLDASAPNGGNGGNIETSAAKVLVSNDAKVTTAAPHGKDGKWLIDPNDFTIAASGGDITGQTLSTELVNTDVMIQSSSGSNGTAGNVNVNDRVSWNANQLTLNAQNNININTSLYGTGTASLALLYGQDAINAGNTSNYYLNNGAEINLPAGQNFSTQLGTDVAPTAYTVITTLGSANSGATTDLQGIQNNLSGNYVLGANINASATSSWNGGGGFTPLGNQTTDFSGTFDGLGHSISNLHINQPSNFGIGLFGYTDPVAVISNTRLLAVNVNGEADVGGLAGYNGGSIFNSFATGTISGSLFVGGLAGANNGAINNSFATASVSGTSFVGGLTGDNSNSINNSYASGSVSGSNAVGGLVGDNDESIVNTVSITNSLSTATVNGATSVGGLVGYNGDGTISGSFWNTDTSGQGSSDGGIGLTSAQMMNPANFTSATSANGNVNPGWDLTNTWTIPAGGTAPVLGALPAQAFSPAENIEAGAPDLPPNQVTTVTTQLVNSVAIPASIPNTTPSDPSAKPLNLSSSTTTTTTVNGVDLKIINGGIKGATEVTNDPL